MLFVYNDMVITTKEYMRHVTEIKATVPHYFWLEDVEDLPSKKLPTEQGFASQCYKLIPKLFPEMAIYNMIYNA